jgi:hypothetical protein
VALYATTKPAGVVGANQIAAFEGAPNLEASKIGGGWLFSKLPVRAKSSSLFYFRAHSTGNGRCVFIIVPPIKIAE